MTSRSLGQPIAAGLVTAFVGFASSFAVVLKGLVGGRRDGRSGRLRADGAVGCDGDRGDRPQRRLADAGLRRLVDARRGAPGGDGATPGGFPAAVGAFVVVGLC